MAARALLLDRDGVVNVDHGYVGTVGRFAFMDGIFELTRGAADRGYRIVVVTNQSGIARGYFGEDDFARLTRWMTDAFEARGVALAAVVHCPYMAGAPLPAWDRDSVWRKPNPGMILEARRRLGLDLARSVFLGDQPTDMAAARAAGVGLRLLLAPARDPDSPDALCPDALCPDAPCPDAPCPDAHATVRTLAEAARRLPA